MATWFRRPALARSLIAAAGGLLLSAAFPGIGMAGAAWIAPGVILFSGIGVRGWRAFRLGYLAGFVHALSAYYWLLAIPYTFHGIPLAPAVGWLALSAYCALYPAVWLWLCCRLMPESLPELGAREALDQFFAASLWRRTTLAFTAGALWAALEFARGRLLTGFPWNFLAVSQYRMLPVIQITAVTGVYGLSFLMVWVSVLLVTALVAVTRRPGQAVWTEAGLPMLLAACVIGYGASQVASIPSAGESLNVALIQPAFPQTLLWDDSQDEKLFQSLLRLSEQALAAATNANAFPDAPPPLSGRPDLLVWPEGAMSVLTPERQQAIARLTSKYGVWLAADAETREPTGQGTTADYNSALLLNPAGEVEEIYHKRRLVIFGEYVPKWLWLFRWMTPMDGESTPGTEAAQFITRRPAARFSPLICFEDTFAEEGRAHAASDTDFLLNLTNDGWFGDGAEPWQHAANAIFRAVENGIPLVRCTNNGLTCWVDAQGRLRQIFGAGGNVYAAGWLMASIPLRAAGDRGGTFYGQHGDWFGWGCCAMGLLAVVRAGLPRRPIGN